MKNIFQDIRQKIIKKYDEWINGTSDLNLKQRFYEDKCRKEEQYIKKEIEQLEEGASDN